MRCATSKAATRASPWTPIRASSIVTMTHNYNLVFPTAIVIALCAGASVLTIKRIK